MPTPAARAAAPTAASGPNPTTLVAVGIALAVVLGIVLFLVPRLQEPGPPTATAAGAAPVNAAGPVGDPSAIDLASMTPEEAALRLFNRVMTSVSQGDSASARSFAPMAIAAYDRIPNPNLDSRYHVAVLHLVNNDPSSARAVSDEILAEVPSHLFGLYTAAQATSLLGDRDSALDLYREFLENYDAELATGRDEYREHSVILPAMREDAERITGGS